MAEQALSGGNVNSSVVRVGDTVRRSLTPASTSVHQLLRHLEREKFRGSPRFLGIDDESREVLSFIEGRTGIPTSIWQEDEPVAASARLLRQYHDATLGFIPAEPAAWAYTYPDARRHEVVCHNDFAPYNFVYTAGIPTAIVDFDLAGPGPRLRDVVYASFWLTPLSLSSADQKGFAAADLKNGSRRLKLFCRTYGISADAALLNMMTEVLAFMGDEQQLQRVLGASVTAKLKANGHLEHWQREAASFEEHRPRVEANLLETSS